MLLKDNLWLSELQQQLRVTMHLKGIFMSKILVYHLKYGYDTWKMLIAWVHLDNYMRKIICFEAHWFKWHLATWMWVIKGNISDDDNAFLSIIWLDGLRGIYREEHWAYIDELLCMSRWLNSSIKFDMLEEYGSTAGNIMAD